MRVKVTEDDIRRGKRHDAFSCPVALAVLRTTGRCWGDVSVSQVIRVGDDRHKTPAKVLAFTNQFDNKGRSVVIPFEFELPEATP